MTRRLHSDSARCKITDEIIYILSASARRDGILVMSTAFWPPTDARAPHRWRRVEGSVPFAPFESRDAIVLLAQRWASAALASQESVWHEFRHVHVRSLSGIHNCGGHEECISWRDRVNAIRLCDEYRVGSCINRNRARTTRQREATERKNRNMRNLREKYVWIN